jgi:hypothetical protein
MHPLWPEPQHEGASRAQRLGQLGTARTVKVRDRPYQASA